MELPRSRVPQSISRYRGNTNSGDISEFIKDTADDVTTLYAIVNENTLKLRELESITTIENRFLFNRVEELEAQLRAKEDIIAGEGTRSIIAKAAKCEPDAFSLGADISDEYSQITPYSPTYTPKLYMHDPIYGTNIIPPSLDIKTEQRVLDVNTGDAVTISLDQIITTENSITNAIDGNSNTCWQRVVKIPATYPGVAVEVDIVIPIPYEVISNRYINTIALCTHPIQGVDIMNVQVKNGSSWETIEGFSDHSQYNRSQEIIPNAKPIRLFFHDMSPTDVKITIRQTVSINEGSYNSYYLGAYSIEVGYSKYMNPEGQFNLSLELAGDQNTIVSIDPIIDNLSIVGNIFRYELYYVNENDIPINVSNLFPVAIPSKKIFIIGWVVSTNGIVPALSAIKVDYQVL